MSRQLTSLKNPALLHAEKLSKRAYRDDCRQVLIEGYREVRRAVDNRHPVQTLYFCPALFLGENEGALLDACRAAGAELLECSEAAFRKISYRDRPDGIIALAPYLELRLEDLRLPADPLLLVAVRIEKPGNLGTLLRSADAAGVDAVIVCDRVTDIHNPNVVRASVGTLFSLPVVECASETLRPWLAARGIRTAATTPRAEAVYFQTDLTGPLAVLLGGEQAGLDAAWIDQADLPLRIPMLGQADSLNVASAGTLVLYEALRQRRFRT
jgi:TrmH family RNA methyltransferase